MSARNVPPAVRLEMVTPLPGSGTQRTHIDAPATTADDSARSLQSVASNTSSAIASAAAASDGSPAASSEDLNSLSLLEPQSSALFQALARVAADEGSSGTAKSKPLDLDPRLSSIINAVTCVAAATYISQALRPPSSQPQSQQDANFETFRRAAVASSPSPSPASSSNQSQTSPASSAHMSWRKRIIQTCSSSRLTVIVGFVTLGACAYYFYGQYIIARRTLDVEVWKDCHDRKVCNQ